MNIVNYSCIVDLNGTFVERYEYKPSQKRDWSKRLFGNGLQRAFRSPFFFINILLAV